MLRVLGGAIAVFVVTNLDGLVVLTALYAQRPSRTRPIVIGHYLGLAALVGASGGGALGLIVIPTRWIGLLGVVPLAFGIRGLVTRPPPAGPPVRISVVTVGSLIIANGADNVSVYTPVFRRIGLTSSLSYSAVFAVLAGLWCGAAALLARHKLTVAAIERWGTIIIPAVFIVVGTALILSTLKR